MSSTPDQPYEPSEAPYEPSEEPYEPEPATPFGWMPRRRGALTGLALVLLGAWGAVIPYLGPYFDYAYTPNSTWTWTAGRFWLQLLPGAVTFLAGLVMLASARRPIAEAATWLAVAAGAWFVVGPLVAPLWRANYIGTPVGDQTSVSVEAIGMFYGLGAAIILFAAAAAGRLSLATPTAVGRTRPRAASPAGADGTPAHRRHHFGLPLGHSH